MAQCDPARPLTPPNSVRPATLAQSICHTARCHLERSVSPEAARQLTMAQSILQSTRRELQRSLSPPDRRTSDRTSVQHPLVQTPILSDEDIRRQFCAVEQELERLNTQYVTKRKSVRIDPAFMPPPDSDVSRSPSPVQPATPFSAMKRARESGQFFTGRNTTFSKCF